MMKRISSLILLAVLLLVACTPKGERKRLDLSGEWQSTLGVCCLPGTTDENALGCEAPVPRSEATTSHLTRLYPYAGIVTYTRDINLPHAMEGRPLQLFMERTKPSTLFVDGDSIGSFGHLAVPHVYTLPPLSAGQHTLSIRIDNRDAAVPSGVHGSHAWVEATQTNWNGILGGFYLETLPSVRFTDVQVYPDVAHHTAQVRFTVQADADVRAKITAKARTWNSSERSRKVSGDMELSLKAGENHSALTLDMGDDLLLWSEFHPSLYRLVLSLSTCGEGDAVYDRYTTNFGMRLFGVKGTQVAINGLPTFLRGKHDGCAFPLTGYCPVDVNTWRHYFRVCREYGINHVRFHSYTPTRACFEAADMEGIYLQAELPLWGSVRPETTAQNEWYLSEASLTLTTFGNHPSFMSFALGNELGGDFDLMTRWLDAFRMQDSRHLYVKGSNNALGYSNPQQGEDYCVTCRLGGGAHYETNTRSSFSFADEPEGGLLNATRPSTRAIYDAVTRCPLPVISHESGQFQIYPDYSELPKYTGVLRPYNLEIFRDRLEKNHLTGQIAEFHEATGRWSAACYKADIEYCLRTPGMGGFQLLDLQDYPGQGTALVGVLDAFMDSKGIVDPIAWRGFCGPVVPLALMDSLCFVNTDTLRFDVTIANYSEETIHDTVRWHLMGDGIDVSSSFLSVTSMEQGRLTDVGRVELQLNDITKSTQLSLTLNVGDVCNHYRLWVYPSFDPLDDALLLLADTVSVNKPFVVAHHLDEALVALDSASTVLYFPSEDELRPVSVGGLFTPDYWNYAMFKSISENARRQVSPGTLGLLMDMSHPLFDGFPTEGHTDWQWWSIVHASRPLILDGTSSALRPLIQVVDNVERNHKLAILVECLVGEGRLMLCTTDPVRAAATPEGAAYLQAIIDWLQRTPVDELPELTPALLRKVFGAEVVDEIAEGVHNITDYTQS